MAYKATSLTSGSATLGADRKNYVYGGDKRVREEPGRPAVTPERARRLAEFARYRDEGASIAEAGARLDPPVGVKTAYVFERDRKMREPAS